MVPHSRGAVASGETPSSQRLPRSRGPQAGRAETRRGVSLEPDRIHLSASRKPLFSGKPRKAHFRVHSDNGDSPPLGPRWAPRWPRGPASAGSEAPAAAPRAAAVWRRVAGPRAGGRPALPGDSARPRQRRGPRRRGRWGRRPPVPSLPARLSRDWAPRPAPPRGLPRPDRARAPSPRRPRPPPRRCRVLGPAARSCGGPAVAERFWVGTSFFTEARRGSVAKVTCLGCSSL